MTRRHCDEIVQGALLIDAIQFDCIAVDNSQIVGFWIGVRGGIEICGGRWGGIVEA